MAIFGFVIIKESLEGSRVAPPSPIPTKWSLKSQHVISAAVPFRLPCSQPLVPHAARLLRSQSLEKSVFVLLRLPCLPRGRFISRAFYVIITATGASSSPRNRNRNPSHWAESWTGSPTLRRIQCPANENGNVRLHKFSLRKKGRKLSSVQKNEMTNEVCRLMAAEMREGWPWTRMEDGGDWLWSRPFEVCAIAYTFCGVAMNGSWNKQVNKWRQFGAAMATALAGQGCPPRGSGFWIVCCFKIGQGMLKFIR